jgi:sortase B
MVIKMSKTKGKLKILIILFRIISIIIILVCLYFLYWWHLDNQKNSSIKQDLSKYIITKKEEEISEEPFTPKYTQATDETGASIEQFGVDFNALSEKNSDCVAWIRIIDTNISYPVVQTTDNDFYLTHNIELDSNGAGWIFADYRNHFNILDQNTLIYGHNRRNGTMFSNLQYYLDSNFSNNPEHKYINFNTKKGPYLAEVFSVYKVSSDDVELYCNYSTASEFAETINNWKNNSLYDFNTEVTSSDNVLTLYTCDDNTEYRILLHAKLIKLY